MAYYHLFDTIIGPGIGPIRNVRVRVLDDTVADGGNPVTLYDGREGDPLSANYVSSDQNGFFSAYVEQGFYTIAYYDATDNLLSSVNDVGLGTYGQAEAEAAAAAAAVSAGSAVAAQAASAASAAAALVSETNAAGSAVTSATQAGLASASASTATTEAATATTQAGIATTQAGIATTAATTATTQAGIATTQASNASTSATNAATSETNAAASEADAETAAATAVSIASGMTDAIALAETVKPALSVLAEWTASGGLDATNEGAPVLAQLTTEYLMVNDQYLPFETLFGLVERYPSIRAMADRISFGQASSPLTFLGSGGLDADGDGYPVVSEGGSAESTTVPASPVSSEGREVEGGAYAFSDAPTELPVFIGIGASNLIGHGGDTPTDTVPEYAGLKMLGSMSIDNAAVASPVGWPATWTAGNYAQWGAAILTPDYEVINSDTENGMISMANMLVPHLSHHLGFNIENTGLKFLIGDSGSTGSSLQQLLDTTPSAQWTRTVNFLSYAANAATTLGYANARILGAVLDYGGVETNVPAHDPTTHYNFAKTAPAILRAEQLSAFGIDKPVFCGVEQQALSAQYYATSAAAERAAWLVECAIGKLAMRPDMFITGIGFTEPYAADSRHMLTLGQARKRARTGVKFAQLLATGKLPVHPYVQTIRWTANGATITFGGGVGEIVTDTDSIYHPAGFNLGAAFHSSSDVPIVITDYYQVATNSWHFETGSSLAAGTRFSLGRCALPNGVLGYTSALSAGPITGPRHCFRDQAGEHPLNQITINGTTHKLHNWVIRCEFIR